MERLLNKSRINLDASELLLKNNLYDSVCHPTYYSCVQLMIYKLKSKGIDIDSLASTKYKGNSHRCYIEETACLLQGQSAREKQIYKNKIKQLKEKREDSDYKTVRITRGDCEKCIATAKELSLIIQRI